MQKDDGTETIIPASYRPPARHRRRRAGTPPQNRRPGLLAWFFLLLLIAVPLAFVLMTRPLEVVTEPDDALVEVDGPVFEFEGRWLALKGPHTVRVEAEGYRAVEQTVEVGALEDDRVTIVLAPLPGSLEVSVPDAGQAEVRLGDGAWRKAPAFFSEVQPGTYQITARAPRFRGETVEVAVRGRGETERLSLTLAPTWGTLEVMLSPEPSDVIGRAELWVDGGLRLTGLGTESAQIELDEGTRNIEVRAPNFAAWQQEIEMQAGTSLTLAPITLLPARATLEVETRPDRAFLTLDGVAVGQAPLEFGLGSGEGHTLRAEAKGYEPREVEFDVGPGETRRVVLTLEPRFAKVRVKLTPPEARLWVDGEPVSEKALAAPEGLRLMAGAHAFSAQAEGYAEAGLQVEVQAGETREVTLALLTEAEAQARAEAERAERIAALPDTVSGPLGMQLRLVRPRPITLGSPRREPGRRANERQREVILERPFYIAIHEVTNAQFKAFAPTHRSGELGGLSLDGPAQPVVNVTWEQAARFANWMSAQAGLTEVYILDGDAITGFHPEADGYRLPTEAEWAFVARSGGVEPWSTYPWGMEMPPPLKFGNYADLNAAELVSRVLSGYRDGYVVSAPVGAFEPNRFGVHDLGGNVSEWVHDVYALDPSGGQIETDPMGTQSGALHSQRGSSWAHGRVTELRFSYRGYGSQGRDDLGFRLARRVQ